MIDPRYTAEMFGPSIARGAIAPFRTIREAREWAESHGTTADACVIRDRKGREIARHARDRAGDRWFRAVPY